MGKKTIQLNKVKKAKATLKIKKENKLLNFLISLKPQKSRRYIKARNQREKQKKVIQKKMRKLDAIKNKISEKHVETTQMKIIKIFKEFLIRVKSEFNISDFSVYTYNQTQSNNIYQLVGENCGTDVILVKYYSFPTTTVIVNPIGLNEAKEYKSRLISRFIIGDTNYMICLSSFAMEAFKDGEKYIIDLINHTKRKVREIN
ncbi:MAG: hypothetical protein RR540_00510 [Oscillospiraceae bacterium]